MEEYGNMSKVNIEDCIVDETETVSNDTDTSNMDTSNNNTSTKASDDRIFDIRTEMKVSGIFEYPKLDVFLSNKKLRSSILTELELVKSKFGESVALKLNDTWYRSSSKPILEESKFIQENNLFPCRVFVAERRSENGRIYYTLRGNEEEEEK